MRKVIMMMLITAMSMLVMISAKPLVKTKSEDSAAVKTAASFYKFEKSLYDLKDKIADRLPEKIEKNKSSMLPLALRSGSTGNLKKENNPSLDMAVRKIKENIRSVFANDKDVK